MIVNEVKRLCDLDDTKLYDFLNGCKEIVEYNYSILMNKTNFLTKKYDN